MILAASLRVCSSYAADSHWGCPHRLGTCFQLLSRALARHAATCLKALCALQVGYGWFKACCMNCDNCVVGKDVS